MNSDIIKYRTKADLIAPYTPPKLLKEKRKEPFSLPIPKDTKDNTLEIIGKRYDGKVITKVFLEKKTLSNLILDILRELTDEAVSTEHLQWLKRFTVCKVNGLEVPQEYWDELKPEYGSRIEILRRVAGGGGGGGGSSGKMGAGTVISAVVMVLAVALTAWNPLGLVVGTLAYAAFVGGVTAAAIGLSLAAQALFPTVTPSMSAGGGYSSGSSTKSLEKESNTYSISGGKNQATPYGYVPLVLGTHRQTPPLVAKSWTSWEGDDQYLHMCVVWGHSIIDVEDFKIGETPLSYYQNVTHVFHKETKGSDLSYFARSFNENSDGSTLTNADGWVQRSLGIANEIQLDVAFTQGLAHVNNQTGEYEDKEVVLEANWKRAEDSEWTGIFSGVNEEYIPTSKLPDLNINYEAYPPDVPLDYCGRPDTGSFKIVLREDGLIIAGYSTYAIVTKKCANEVSPTTFLPSPTLYPTDALLYARILDTNAGYWHDTVDNPCHTYTYRHKYHTEEQTHHYELYPNRVEGLEGQISVEFFTDNDLYQVRIITQDLVLKGMDIGSDTNKGALRVEYNDSFIKFIAGTTKSFVRTFKITDLPKAEYDIRIRRVTADDTDRYDYSTVTLRTTRAVLYEAAFQSPVDLCVSELRIRASEQLSNYIDDFNGLCHSICPVHHNNWTTMDRTRNPAALYRYLLTSEGLHTLRFPYTIAKIDDDSITAFAKWCEEKEYYFDYICDSEESAWARLTAVVSAGRGGISYEDGRYGVIIDSTGKMPVQLFTPRNSWGFSLERSFVNMPDALLVSWINANNNYQQDQSFIFNDGYYRYNSTNIVEWEFPGITDWHHLYRMGRHFLAKMLHRQITITINTDFEWLIAKRGDLVGVASDVLMNIYGTARIKGLIYTLKGKDVEQTISIYDTNDIPIDNEGRTAYPIGIELDDDIMLPDDPALTCGVCIRRSDGSMAVIRTFPMGSDNAGEVVDRDTTSVLYFDGIVNETNYPEIGNLITYSLINSTYTEYLLAGIKPSANMSAQLTLIPYAAEAIEKAATEKIPDYEPIILLPIFTGRKLPRPIIIDFRSDISMTVVNKGSMVFQLAIYWGTGGQPVNEGFTVEAQVWDDEGSFLSGYCHMAVPYVTVGPVVQDRLYYAKIRLVGYSGNVSEWSVIQTTIIRGLLDPPPDIECFEAHIEYPAGIRCTWCPCTAIDFARYRFLSPFKEETTATSHLIEPFDLWGDVICKIVAVDVLGIVSSNTAEDSVWIDRPATPTLQGLDARSDGVYILWQDCETTWPLIHYHIKDPYTNEERDEMVMEFIISPRSEGTYTLEVQAFDKFNLHSYIGILVYSIKPLEPPVCTLEIRDGIVRINWEPVISTFPIKTYQVYSVDGVLLKETDSTFYDVIGPEGMLEFRIRAIDTCNNIGAFAEVSLLMTKPDTPEVNVQLNDTRMGLIISWKVPNSMLPIRTYDVVRQWDITRDDGIIETKEEDYGSTDATELEVEAIVVGVHTFMVRAVDSSGNKSDWGTFELNVFAPSKPLITDVNVIDNNVLIYWDEPRTQFFAIEYYNFNSIDNNGYVSLIGRIDARFTGYFERVSGLFTYQVCPVDAGGNIGGCSKVSAQVDQPPDFVLFNEMESLFNGEKTNCVLDGIGGLMMPVNVGETWVQNIIIVMRKLGIIGPNEDPFTRINPERYKEAVPTYDGKITWNKWGAAKTWWDVIVQVARYLEKEPEEITWINILEYFSVYDFVLIWKDKVDNDMDNWLAPPAEGGFAQYVEEVDVGALIENANIFVTPTITIIKGDPELQCDIAIKATPDDSWKEVAHNSWSTYANDFRYVRYTITCQFPEGDDGMLHLEHLWYRIDLKEKTEAGRVYSDKNDNAEGFIDITTTPDLYGTFVKFKTAFRDVQYGPVCVSNSAEYTWCMVNFKDVFQPEGFRVAIYNSKGERISGYVEWNVRGV